MTEEAQNPERNAQEVYQEVLSHTRYLDRNWKGLIKLIVENVSETGQIEGTVELKNGSYFPGAGYKADIDYGFAEKVYPDRIRDDDSIGDKQALEEAVSTLKSLVEPLELLRGPGEEPYVENVSICGPILERPLEEYGQEQEEVVPERNIAAEDSGFLHIASKFNFNYIRKRDIPQMREALQERFPDNYARGQPNDLGRVSARKVISEFKKKLTYIRKRLNED